MAVPTTRATLKTRTLAVIVELDELNQGAHTLAGGLDGGTAAQLSACSGVKTRLRDCHKGLNNAATRDTVQSIA